METKIRSQGGGNVEVYVKYRTKWRHKYILAGISKERATYDQLTMDQWMTGFCGIMRDEPS